MKAKVVFWILIIYPVFAYSQFKPIIDSSIVCSNGNTFSENPLDSKKTLEIFYIVEKMPKPKIQLKEIENMLEKGIPPSEQEFKSEGNLFLQCIVNCKGMAGDFQIIQCPPKLDNICKLVINVFRESLISWNPGQQRGKNVDVLIKIQVSFKNGKFKVEAPIY